MKNTVHKKHSKKQWLPLLVMSLLLPTSTLAQAGIRLSSDWQSSYRPDGSRVPEDQDEGARMDKAAKTAADKRTAVPPSFTIARYQFPLGFKIHLDDMLFYLQPATYMRKNRPNEVCNPDYSKGTLAYACMEGQRHTQDCHLFFFDQSFVETGYHTLNIKEPYEYFCNAVPAIGVGKKTNNELLVTVQYFPIDRKLASKVSEIGSGWQRMTILVRVSAENGKLVVEQDDTCLGNPNTYQDIPSARKALARCGR